ncbi:thiamine phosphate synthase [Planctomycetales bacterium ZRK34]|nr:thiamine phosphate synthase [Planctomycetales bacterium ZRK34]
MPPIARTLDANANRAREAMRVMEDAARFCLDDSKLARDLKNLRHDFAAAVRSLPDLPAHRDTPGDVGTSMTTAAERTRATVADVAIAAGKRLTEALRSCEEFGKLISPDFAAAVKQLRYRAYTLEQRLVEKLAPFAARQWQLCVLITASMCEHHDWLDVARACIDAGADCIQLREKDLDDGDLLDRASQLVDLAKNTNTSVVLNDRADLALLAGCAGVHLGQHDLPVATARKLVGRQLLIGTSTHNLTEARRAIRDGVDYCGVGAIFATATKQRRPAGCEYLRKFVDKFPDMPHLAIGGVTPDSLPEVIAAGARGVAVSSAVCAATNPTRVVRRIINQFKKAHR